MSVLKVFLFSLIFSLSLVTYAKDLDIAWHDSPVIDEVGLLSTQSARQLDAHLYDLRKNNDLQLQVYIIKSLNDLTIEEAAIKIFDKWKLGNAKTDRGILFLIAPNEKRLRIEVGQGLEGDLPDVIAKRIIADVVVPYFKRGEFAMGVLQGVSSIENYALNTNVNLKAEAQQLAEKGEATKSSNLWIILVVVGIWVLIFIFNPSLALYILFSAMSGGRGGGGSSRDSWSGGGGKSSGGGASGGW